MRKQKIFPYGLGFLILAALLLIAQWKLDFHWGNEALASRRRAFEKKKQAQGTLIPQPTREEERQTPASFLERLRDESEKVGRPTSAPEKVEEDLEHWGKNLTANQISVLREVIFNGQNPGDEIALSLDLLGRSDQPEAQRALVDFILQGPLVPSRELHTFQLLALDGIIAQSERTRDSQALQKIRQESQDALLSRRAAQGLNALGEQAPWPRETDERALGTILSR